MITENQTPPLFPFLDALATLFRAGQTVSRLEEGGYRAYLAQLLPEVGIQAGPLPPSLTDQQGLFRAVAAFVQDIARLIPVAILLDDLH